MDDVDGFVDWGTDAPTKANRVLDPWLRAKEAFEAEPFERGEVVERDRVYGMMGITPLSKDETARSYKAREQRFVGEMVRFERWLLAEHKLLLETIPGRGWRVVPVEEHVDVANRMGRKEIAKAIRDWGRDLENAPVDDMDAKARARAEDSLERVQMLARNVRRGVRGL